MGDKGERGKEHEKIKERQRSKERGKRGEGGRPRYQNQMTLTLSFPCLLCEEMIDARRRHLMKPDQDQDYRDNNPNWFQNEVLIDFSFKKQNLFISSIDDNAWDRGDKLSGNDSSAHNAIEDEIDFCD